MTLKTYKFVSGIDKENTRYASEGRWWDMDKMRFRSGTPEKMGGWQKTTENQFAGVCRKLFNWIDLDNDNIIALGTSAALYGEVGGRVFNITPMSTYYTIDTVPSTNNCLQTFDNSFTVRINLTGVTAAVGTTLIISGATSVGGISSVALNGVHTITAVGSSYVEIEVSNVQEGWGEGGWSDSAWGSVAVEGWGAGAWDAGSWGESGSFIYADIGGGTHMTIGFALAPGNEVATSGYGWGAGVWSRGGWGSAATVPAGGNEQMRLWSFDNFGENLLANVRNGQIYYWEPELGYTSDNRAYPLSQMPGASDTPLHSSVVISTDERHVVAFGANPIGSTIQDPLLIRWSDQEDPAMWTPTATNSAGDLRVPIGSYIVGAVQTRQETLVFTDSSLHSLQYIGAPYVFSLQTLADNVSLIGPNAAITVNNVTYWMGTDRFYAYSGRVENLPCTLLRFVFSNINKAQGYQVYAGTNNQFGEIVWFYCSKESLTVDSYVVFNYFENIWYYGTMDRTAWMDSQLRGAPYATAYDGYAYLHESGCDDGSTQPPSPIHAYIESADFDIDDGDRFSFIKRIIPDLTFQNSTSSTPSVTYTLKARNFPGATFDEVNTRGVTAVSNEVDQYTNQVWTRVRGRQAAVRIESTDLGVMWQAGCTRLDLRPDGRR